MLNNQGKQVMQKSSDGILYSASDLGDFLLCKHLINLKRIDLDTPLQKDEVDEQYGIFIQ